MRITLDTNTIVSAIIAPKGKSAFLLSKCKERIYDLVLSKAILDEVKRVMTYPHIEKKYHLSADRQKGVINFLKQIAEIILPKEKIEIIKNDPSDNRILECAVAGKVDFIITGDKRHLLPLKAFQGIVIITVADFLRGK